MKTAELRNATELQLDWLAAKVQGYFSTAGHERIPDTYWDTSGGVAHFTKMRDSEVPWTMCTSLWDEFGSLLDKLIADGWQLSMAECNLGIKMSKHINDTIQVYRGETIGIAVVRCYVVTNCGSMVAIPDSI